MTSPDGSLGPGEFAEEFKTSFRTLWLIAVSVVRDTALAEDVVQEAAMVALSKLDQFSPGTSFTAWMGRIVRFVALNSVRKERKRRHSPHDGETLEQIASEKPPPALADGPRDWSVTDRHLVDALEQVGEVARSCLVLRTLGDLPYVEIARLLEIPEGTAMSHVHRTRQLLRERLRAKEDGSTRS